MPGEAVKSGSADFVLPLDRVAAKLLELVKDSGSLKKQAAGADKRFDTNNTLSTVA